MAPCPPAGTQRASVRGELAELAQATATARAELAALEAELTLVRTAVDGARAAQLLQANEQLVLSALRAQEQAEGAERALDVVAQQSQRDTLTGALNRALMLERVDAAIALARRHAGHMAVLFIDVDRFKAINDTLGHAIGDEVLRQLAQTLGEVLRESDAVGRHGGDEFVVLLSEVARWEDVELIIDKLHQRLDAPHQIGQHTMALSASIGGALFPRDGANAAALIEHADAGMYHDKLGRRDLAAARAHSAVRGGDAHAARTITRLPRARPPAATAKASDQDLCEANEQLVLSALTAQVQEAQAELEHGRQIQFLAMVAHELRNPLLPIRLAIDRLGRVRGDAEQLAQLQATLKGQVSHLSRLIGDLVDGSRVSFGKFTIERRHVDLRSVVKQALEMCQPAMAERQQVFTLQWPVGPADAFWLDADPVRLAQVVANLLDNACKYTPVGGQIMLTVARAGDALTLAVSDTGIGISAEALPHVFDLFVQDPRALAVHDRGLGIGLAVVRHLVEAHGGTVTAQCAGVDQGSCFTVCLPAPV